MNKAMFFKSIIELLTMNMAMFFKSIIELLTMLALKIYSPGKFILD